MHTLDVGPHFERPAFPDLTPEQQVKVPDTERVVRSFRTIYDWKAYTPEGLAIMEAYWDRFVDSVFARLLPEHMQDDRERYRGINLGTFNGTYQKAWVRNGYPMYGVEIADVIDELEEYGLEGARASFFDLSGIEAESFDFGVIDRSICTQRDYETFDRCYEEDGPVTEGPQTVPGLFDSIFRIIKPGGALIGILYAWYSGHIVGTLAQHGALKIWPTYLGLLGFRVVKDPVETEVPAIESQIPSESPLFRRFYPTEHGLAGLYMPTNQIVIGRPQESIEFAPRSEHWAVLSR